MESQAAQSLMNWHGLEARQLLAASVLIKSVSWACCNVHVESVRTLDVGAQLRLSRVRNACLLRRSLGRALGRLDAEAI